MGLMRLFKTAVRKTRVHWVRELVCFIGVIGLTSGLHAGQYFQNFYNVSAGATNFNDGSTLSSTALGTVACVTNLVYSPVSGSPYSELQLTESGTNDVQSAFELPDLDSGAPIYAFSVKWNSDLKGFFPGFGDGFSFNFGALSSVNLITNNAEETGYGVGLCFSVQTDAGTNSGFFLLANGSVIASVTNNSSVEWGTNSTIRHFWEVDWNYYSGMSVRLDGKPIFTNVATTGFLPEGGDVFAWGARCDTNTEEMRLDNIVALTGGNLVQLPTSAPYFAENGYAGSVFSVTNAFDGTNSTVFASNGGPTTAGATVSPPNTVMVYALTSGQHGDTSPRAWTLEGSTNGGVLWSDIGGGGGYFVNAAETRAWPLTNSTAYGAYGLLFNGAFGFTTTIGELRFYALNLVGAPFAAWTNSGAFEEDYTSIASSADGIRLAAAFEGISRSTNSGLTWALGPQPPGEFTYIASSFDGSKLAACGSGSRIATNSVDPRDGQTLWGLENMPGETWKSITCSSNFSILAAAVENGEIYVSTNSANTWTATASTQDWDCVVASADGSTLAATVFGGGIYISTNWGNIWTATSAPTNEWTGIASSSDGTKLAAASYQGIYVSTNSGSAWSLTGAPTNNRWTAIASSWDGTRLAATCSGAMETVYLSADSGNTWTGAQLNIFNSVTSSADGTKLAACGNGYIYTYGFRAPPSPSLNAFLSGGYPVLSWDTTNGGNFVLQESTNLLSTNWSDVSWPVRTNSLRYQVTDLPTGGQKFYRLVAQ